MSHPSSQPADRLLEPTRVDAAGDGVAADHPVHLEYRDFLENAVEALHRIGPDGIIRWANQAELEMLGYARDEYIGRHIAEFHADREVIDDMLARLWRNEVLRNYPARLRCRDGSIRHVLVNSSVLWRDGEFVHTRCFTRDVTALEQETSRRSRAERYLNLQLALTRVLIDAPSLEGAAPDILRALCEGTGSVVAAIWSVDDATGTLRCVAAWQGHDAAAIDAFVTATREMRFTPGRGLPGRVWSSGRPAWIVDVAADANFPRAPSAARAGLHGAFAFPIRVRERTTGVVECFSAASKPPDDALLDIVEALGDQIGQFSERRGIEETRARLAAIVDSSDDAIISEALDGTITSWNRGAERILGYAAAEAVGRHISLIIPDHRRGEEEIVLARLRAGQHLDHFDTERRTKDGRIVNVSLTVSPIRDSEGHVIGASKVARDISERMQKDRALRESEERYRRLVSLMPAAVYTCEAPSGRITFYNDRARELWGRAPVIGDSDARFCGSFRLWWPDGRPLRHEDTPMAVALGEGQAFRSQEVVIERPDGSRISVLVNIDPVQDDEGTVIGAINVFHDTTALRAAQEELRRSEEQLRAVVDTTPGCIKIVGRDGTLLQMNAGGLALVEAEGADLVVGRSIFGLVADEWREAFRAFHERICRGEKGTLRFDVVGLRGTRRRVETHAAPLPAGDGGFLHLAVTHDVTQRTRAEQASQRHGERIRLLWEAASVLLTGNEPDAMLKGVFSRIGPSLGLDVYLNYILTESGDGLRIASCAGIEHAVAARISRLELGQAVCGTVALRRTPVVATRIQHSDEPMVQLVKGLGIRAYACSPLLAGDRLLGTLSFASRTRDDFEQDEIEFLQTICQYVAAAYERLRLIEQLREQDRRKDEFLATLAHELRNPLAPIRTGVQLIRRAGKAPRCSRRRAR
jgi:PAS domain S-box-containing protein